jgi:hypothetical protein
MDPQHRVTYVYPFRPLHPPDDVGTADGTPGGVLFFKAGGNLTAVEVRAGGGVPRARDEQDFAALLPVLTGAGLAWLRDSLATVRPDHPWLAKLHT